MTLFDMTDQARALYDLLESGEIDEQTFTDTLEAIGADEKMDSYCKITRQFMSDYDALKAERDRLTLKMAAAQAAIERMKDAMHDMLVLTEDGKVKTALFSAAIRRTQSAEITDETAIPAEYRVAQPDKISKSDILRDLKAGKEISGAALRVNESVVIR